MSEAISSCVRYAEERLAEQLTLRPLEDNERSPRQRLSPANAAALYRKILFEVNNGKPVHIVCRRHNASAKAFNAWVTHNGLRRK